MQGSLKRREYLFYYTGNTNNSHHGVGILVDKALNPIFSTISERICTVSVKTEEGRTLHCISAYAPTLKRSEDDPKIREDFYEQLEKAISKFPKRDIVTIVGDFNAKTGSGWQDFSENMGKFGKGQINSNGRYLLETIAKHEMLLTNTTFDHKMAHRSTWTCPERINPHKDKNGNTRRNPYRNQIDYILINNKFRCFVTNSRSYSGIETETDHKLVKANLNIQWWKKHQPKPSNNIKINLHKLENLDERRKYHDKVQENHQKKSATEDPQMKWNNIIHSCKTAGNETLGQVNKQVKHEDQLLSDLSRQQKKVKNNIEASNSKEERQQLRIERNHIMAEIHSRVKTLEDEKIDYQLQTIEIYKDDTSKCFRAMKELNSKKPRKPLVIENTNGEFVGSETEQINIITKHFQQVFATNATDEYPEIYPTEMKDPFTSGEILKAAQSLKNGRSVGEDGLNAEYLKYAPPIIHEEIASLFNTMAETGNYPAEIKEGILTPLPKPGKKAGPPANLRPIILLSNLRKILAVCLIRRCWDKISAYIPISQAAYQAGRSTTEHVFAIKILAEKAITSSDYHLHLLMLDMSKAFDTVNRPKLLEDLKQILEPDELHLMSILIKDVRLKVKVANNTGAQILTEVGIAQGDCLSAILFILYLARTINEAKSNQDDHSYATSTSPILPFEHLDHNYYTPSKNSFFEIDPKYADDISWATTARHRVENVKKTMPTTLRKRDLLVNDTKTEEHEISRNGEEEWKSCKLLGSLLDTEKDVNRRKILAINAITTLKSLLNSRKNSLQIKLRAFNAFVASIFLYNSELWTLTKCLENTIDTFQRRQLRGILGIRWPKKITNDELYKKTKCEPWSKTIKRRRLNWLGHLIRLHPDTPARKALREYLRTTKRPRGRPKFTWMQQAKQDLQCANINLDLRNDIQTIKTLEELTHNRQNWHATVKYVMLQQ